MSRLTRDGTAEPGANTDGEILFFPVQLTTREQDWQLTRLILTLLLHVMTLHTYRYIHAVIGFFSQAIKATVMWLTAYYVNGHDVLCSSHV